VHRSTRAGRYGRRIELGVYTFAELTDESVTAAQRLRNLLEEIELADEVGLDVFGVGEHHRPDFAVSAPAVVLAAAAFALIFNVSQSLQTALGGYTTAIQKHVEETSLATKHLDALKGGGNAFAAAAAKAPKSSLPVLGNAPDFVGIADWLNTPGNRPLSLASLRGKVVLIDFWTYSCINCIRTLPHLRAWYAAYHKDGLVIVGVHTPEFAFEHVLSNVRQATHSLDVMWPVALDNDYGTWSAYSNQYWPAEYLIDKSGRVRHYHFGEGDYGGTEQTTGGRA